MSGGLEGWVASVAHPFSYPDRSFACHGETRAISFPKGLPDMRRMLILCLLGLACGLAMAVPLQIATFTPTVARFEKDEQWG